jgi:hypothetical protein
MQEVYWMELRRLINQAARDYRSQAIGKSCIGKSCIGKSCIGKSCIGN